jgi:tetratricopeptide (TPR) repeat protein
MTEYRASSENASKSENQNESIAISAIETEKLLASDPAAAEARARKFLMEHPGNSGALLLLGAALRRRRKLTAAKDVLESLTRSQPSLVLAYFELGLTLGELGEHREAIRILACAIDLMPNFPDAWYALAEQLDVLSSTARSREAGARIAEALGAARSRHLTIAETRLRELVDGSSSDQRAQFPLSVVLLAQEKGHEALPLIERLVADEPNNGLYQDLRAAALFQIEEFGEAIAQYEDILKESPKRPGAWMSYGRALRALGRQQQCVAAFKRAIELLPTWVEAHRTLASVKSYRFEPVEIDALRALLADSDLPAASHAELHFSLGRALEDQGAYPEAFENFRESQKVQRANVAYDADVSTRWLRREMAVFSSAFIHERAGAGSQSADPIFIVGMPRSGSTLVQEILCAHSAIERTGELRDLTWMVARLDKESTGTGLRYPDVLRTYDRDRFRALGEEYLERTRPRRKLGRPFFVDKYPGNFVRAALTHLILPNAKIVDVRRHPFDCCLSCFKNYFPEGQAFSHSLSDLGRYYADYVELMAHFDAVLPGKIHRVFYEQLVENPESEVRRLLDYLELPFEDECMRFYEREQAVMTSSSEQVRVPVYKTGVGGWRNYERWIHPLKSALGYVGESYPAVPRFYSNLQVSMTMRLA